MYEPGSPALQADSLSTEPPGKPMYEESSRIKLFSNGIFTAFVMLEVSL